MQRSSEGLFIWPAQDKNKQKGTEAHPGSKHEGVRVGLEDGKLLLIREAPENWGRGVPCPLLGAVAVEYPSTAGTMSGGSISRCFLLSEPSSSWGQGVKEP